MLFLKHVTHAGVVCLIAIPSDGEITTYMINAERNDELSNCMFLIGQIVIIDFVVFVGVRWLDCPYMGIM